MTEKRITTAALIYFLIGLLFALIFAMYYRWEVYSIFSPSFYMVVFSWPFQLPGFISDLFVYGLSGKTLL